MICQIIKTCNPSSLINFDFVTKVWYGWLIVLVNSEPHDEINLLSQVKGPLCNPNMKVYDLVQ